ncbi:Conidiation-specific protein 10 [Klebsiella pneumoniae IS39]|nr:Conidiation-specific protein 10 [Klebsiella pneumoniae IS39]
MAVPATLPKTVKEHQKQDVKVASIAGGILKNDPQRASEAATKRGVKNSHGSRES